MTSNLKPKRLPEARPVPPHRHAAPMGPWPWVARPNEQTSHRDEGAEQWKGYPQVEFPNRTPAQIRASGIADAIEFHSGITTIYVVDILRSGVFKEQPSQEIIIDDRYATGFQASRPHDVSIRAMFADNLGGSALQMLGSKYNIEPLFFSSSLNRTPSRYAESIKPKKGDHITITLTFLRVKNFQTNIIIIPTSKTTRSSAEVNIQAPLILLSPNDHSSPKVTSPKVFILDLLAIHVVRDRNSSTIISYHPAREECTTSAKELHAHVKFAGNSVYWQKIFKNGKNANDPTFVLLAILWHPLYSWGKALEVMYTHFCWLESQVTIANDMKLVELRVIYEHLLQYTPLLQNFRKSVEFIIDTPNPAMDALNEKKRKQSQEQLHTQCGNLISEISRVESWRDMMDKRVKSIMYFKLPPIMSSLLAMRNIFGRQHHPSIIASGPTSPPRASRRHHPPSSASPPISSSRTMEYVDASHSTFNEIHGNQNNIYNFNTYT